MEQVGTLNLQKTSGSVKQKKSIWKKIRNTFLTMKLFYLLSRIARNPDSTAAGLAIADCLLALGLIGEELELLYKDPECRRTFSERKMLKTLDLRALQKLPEGTVGRIYADRMIQGNLDPNFYKTYEIKSDELFLMMRMRQTHDLWHVITGFGTETAGELGLQAFMIAQTHTTLAPLLIGGRLVMICLKDPAEARNIVNQVSRGWLMGQKAKPIFGLDWESHWTTPLPELRSLYNVHVQ